MTAGTRQQTLQQKLADHELTEEECHEYRAMLEDVLDRMDVEDMQKLVAALVIGAINNRLIELKALVTTPNVDGKKPRGHRRWWHRWWGI